MNLEITNLKSRKQHIETVARWLFEEWGQLRPGSTLAATVEWVAKKCEGHGIPSVYVAEIDGIAAGTISLVEHDMDIRRELTPWVASVYVRAESRNLDIGSELMRFMDSVAGGLGVERMYLFTPNKQRMYSRLGWQTIEELEYRNENVTVMQKILSRNRLRR